MRTFARFVLLVLVLAGGAIVGVTAYNAGVTAGLAQDGAVVVNPGGYPVGPYVGYGGPDFGFFGFIGFVFFLLLLFGLIGAATGGGRHGRGGPAGPRRHHDGRHDWRGGPWEDRAREVHDAWHRGETGPAADPASPAAADR